MKVVLAAEETAGRQTLDLLEQEGLRPVAVLASAEGPVGRRAAALGIPPLPPETVKDGGWRPDCDLLLNVHALHLIHPAVAAAPRIGAFNLHPGPLPGYAGLNAPSWALANGEDSHGVTLHWIDGGIDTGPIAYQALFPLAPDDTGLLVGVRCVRHGLPLIRRLLRDAPGIPRLPQRGTRRYFGRAAPVLRWDRPAAEIERLVRAHDYTPLPSPWGRPTSVLGSERIEIRKLALTGRACDAAPGTVRQGLVAARDEWLRLTAIGRDGRPLPVTALPDGARLT